MSLVIRLIGKYAIWIYVLCALGMLYYLRAALAARREGSQALFSLEQEAFAKQVYRSSGMILLLMAVVVGVYALSHYANIPQPTDSPVVVPTATSAEPTPTRPGRTPAPGDSTPTVEATATRRPRATTIVLPTIAQGTPTVEVLPAKCPHPNVQVLEPGANKVIDGGIQVRGTAQKDNFDRYEFKFQSRDFADEWHWVQTFGTPVENGDLGWWHTAHLPNGNYRFMLIVIDKTGNSQECVVPVVVRHP